MDKELRWRWFIEWDTRYDGHLRAIKKVIYQGRSRYQEIEIIEFHELGKALIIDGLTQSSIYDEHIYHEALVHPAMILHDSPEKILIIGGGEGATLREVLKYRSVKEVHMVDLDDEVIKVSKKYLPEMNKGSFDDPRLKLIIDDGRKFIEDKVDEYDVIILDLVDPIKNTQAVFLYTIEFYEKIRKSLKENGVIVTQATSPSSTLNVYSVIYNTIKHIFRFSRPYSIYMKSFDDLWGFVIASDKLDIGKLSLEDINKRIKDRVFHPLRFYDGETHIWMFTLPKNIREKLFSEDKISTDKEPISLSI